LSFSYLKSVKTPTQDEEQTRRKRGLNISQDQLISFWPPQGYEKQDKLL
jgi:hypothetical protein